MTTCPSCKHSVSRDAFKCPICGKSFDDTSGATVFLPADKKKAESWSIQTTESADGARFAAGTMLALAGWAFHTSLGGQKLFAGNFLEE